MGGGGEGSGIMSFQRETQGGEERALTATEMVLLEDWEDGGARISAEQRLATGIFRARGQGTGVVPSPEPSLTPLPEEGGLETFSLAPLMGQRRTGERGFHGPSPPL